MYCGQEEFHMGPKSSILLGIENHNGAARVKILNDWWIPIRLKG